MGWVSLIQFSIKATKELMEACGFPNIQQIHARKFFRRIDGQATRSFGEIYFEKLNQLKQQQNF